jgi:DNA transposition AAA+ family ATPase
MNDTLKKEVAGAAKTYLDDKGISLNELSRRADINQAYVSQILNQKSDNIADKWYYTLAKTIGFPIDVIYWEHVPTAQYKAIVNYLEEARENGRNRVLIGDTGCGKTYAINRYLMTKPLGTFRVTVSSLHSVHILIEDLMNCIGLEPVGTPVTRLRNIAHKLSMFQLEGMKPLILIDECENMKATAFGIIKSLYDQLEGVCPVVLIGTSQIKSKITNMLKLNKVGIPQFQRRFIAGERYLPDIDKTFKLFLENKVDDKRLANYLRRICNNYGELHDYLETALKEADKKGVDLTYGFFCEIHGIKEAGYRQ